MSQGVENRGSPQGLERFQAEMLVEQGMLEGGLDCQDSAWAYPPAQNQYMQKKKSWGINFCANTIGDKTISYLTFIPDELF